jgi:uncharacterized protein involved in exopolysaccharide biosynthesis
MIRLFLLRFTESYFRHRWLYVLPTLFMLIAASFYIALEKPKYNAYGSIYVRKESLLASLTAVRNNDTSLWLSAAQETSNELNDLIQTDAFVRAVIHNTDLEAKMGLAETNVEEFITETRNSIGASVQGDNQVQINAAMQKPEIAVQAVNAIMETYIQWRVNGQRGESESAQAFFNEQINKYKADLDNSRQSIKNYILANPAPIQGNRPEIEQMELSRLQADIDLIESRLVGALDKEEEARLSLAQLESDIRQSYTIIDAPRLPDKPEVSKKDQAIRLFVFLIIGIVLDIGAVVGGMLLDRSFNLPLDVPFSLNLPVLTIVPDVSQKTRTNRFASLFRKGKKATKPASESTSVENQPENIELVENIDLMANHNQEVDLKTDIKV